MIRPATLADIPAMVAMGRTFTDKAGFGSHTGYNEQDTADFLEALIEAPEAVCLVGPECMAAAIVTPSPFNRAHKAAQELFWWAQGRNGVRLFKALETAVRAIGAHSLIMVTTEAIRPDATGRFYERQGYRPLERNFIKVF
ncbi:hypothetical protein Pan3_09 [Pseudanabaena phage Pan3]|nr:hypothetical protein Pan3_09 [Pseudanabaena phage Pan3]